MKSYKHILENYADSSNDHKAITFFEDYYLPYDNYKHKYQAIFNKVFSPYSVQRILNADVFRSHLYSFSILGGCLFLEDDFNGLKRIMNLNNDKYFFILEDSYVNQKQNDKSRSLGFLFPATLTWDELNGGGDISYELIVRPIRNYFVLGSNGNWGKFSGNDLLDPVESFGFSKELEYVFKKEFESLE